MNLSVRLKELREREGLSQAKLANELNVSVGCVGMWESKKQIPPAIRLMQIADFFGVSLDYLLGRDTKDDKEFENIGEEDKLTEDCIKLFNVMTDLQKGQVFGYAVALLEQSGENVDKILGNKH